MLLLNRRARRTIPLRRSEEPLVMRLPTADGCDLRFERFLAHPVPTVWNPLAEWATLAA